MWPWKCIFHDHRIGDSVFKDISHNMPQNFHASEVYYFSTVSIYNITFCSNRNFKKIRKKILAYLLLVEKRRMDYEAKLVKNETIQDTSVSLLLHIKIKDINSETLNNLHSDDHFQLWYLFFKYLNCLCISNSLISKIWHAYLSQKISQLCKLHHHFQQPWEFFSNAFAN